MGSNRKMGVHNGKTPSFLVFFSPIHFPSPRKEENKQIEGNGGKERDGKKVEGEKERGREKTNRRVEIIVTDEPAGARYNNHSATQSRRYKPVNLCN